MLVVIYTASEAQMRQAPQVGPVRAATVVKIWDVKSGRELRTLQSASSASEAGFSAGRPRRCHVGIDGRYLVVGCRLRQQVARSDFFADGRYQPNDAVAWVA